MGMSKSCISSAVSPQRDDGNVEILRSSAVSSQRGQYLKKPTSSKRREWFLRYDMATL
jgi:hypothetical protein